MSKKQLIIHQLRALCLKTIFLGFILSGHCLVQAKGDGSRDLVWVMDGSSSIDSSDFQLEKQGMIVALQNPQLVPRDGTIAFALVQFADTSTRIEAPFHVISSESDVNTIVTQISAIVQLEGDTNPGDGVNTAMSILRANGRTNASQDICLFTDGTPNSGASISSAITSARASGLDAFGVIGIQDPGNFYEADLRSVYEPLTFGGAGVGMVFSSTEFANSVGPICFGGSVTLIGLEVTQSIQDWENSVPLIKDKLTYVRAHLETSDPGVTQTPVSARLRAFRGALELAESPLTPLNAGFFAKPNAAQRRGNWTDSLNFRLPTSWADGTIQLYLEGFGGSIDCTAAAATDDNCRLMATFIPTDTLEVKYIAVKWSQGTTTHNPNQTDLAQLENRTIAISPIARLNATRGTLTYSGPFVNNLPVLDNVNSQLEMKRLLDLCWSWLGCDRRYYGCLVGPDIGGKANDIPGTVASGTKQDVGYGVHRHTHEVAHTLGIRHAAPFCGAADPAAPAFPYTFSVQNSLGVNVIAAALGPMTEGDDKFIYGLDTDTVTVIDPNRIFELMSYCGSTGFTPSRSRWISKFTYENLRNAINSNFILEAAAATAGGPTDVGRQRYLIIRGLIETANDTLQFLPFQSVELPMPPPEPTPNAYTLQLLDASTNLLNSISFAPAMGSGDTTVGSFLIPVPVDPAIKQVRILHDSKIIGERVASAATPLVKVLFPNGGETLAGNAVEIRWTASDPDSDSLYYTVQYSPDGGVSWETLVVDWPETSFPTDFTFLAGSTQAVIRVIASDGFNDARDVSDMFFTTDNTPTLQILSPQDGASFFGVQTVFLRASAFDIEDGPLGSSRFKWYSNLNGFLGTGDDINVRADRLLQGNHRLTVTVSDSVGNVATNTINIGVKTIFAGTNPPPTLTISAFGSITLNRQTGLYQQDITITNVGVTAVEAFRVNIANLPNGIQVYNASGTNGGMPFIQYGSSLMGAGSVALTIEYYSTNRVTVPAPVLSVEVATAATLPHLDGANLNIRRSQLLADGSFVVEIDTTLGRTYVVEYSTDMITWKQAVPPIMAFGSRLDWLDSGPPKTESRPIGASRFYRVIQLP